MSLSRMCSRNGCRQAAVATLTYVYADSTAVVGPLATYAEPHTYDLCAAHAERLTAPRGWDIVRLAGEYHEQPPTPDDLVALAEAVREAGRPRVPEALPAPSLSVAPRASVQTEPSAPSAALERGRRGHLRALPDHD